MIAEPTGAASGGRRSGRAPAWRGRAAACRYRVAGRSRRRSASRPMRRLARRPSRTPTRAARRARLPRHTGRDDEENAAAGAKGEPVDPRNLRLRRIDARGAEVVREPRLMHFPERACCRIGGIGEPVVEGCRLAVGETGIAIDARERLTPARPSGGSGRGDGAPDPGSAEGEQRRERRRCVARAAGPARRPNQATATNRAAATSTATRARQSRFPKQRAAREQDKPVEPPRRRRLRAEAGRHRTQFSRRSWHGAYHGRQDAPVLVASA